MSVGTLSGAASATQHPLQPPPVDAPATSSAINEAEDVASYVSVLLTGALFLCIYLAVLIRRGTIRHLPESAASILVGFATGVLVRLLHLTKLQSLLRFDPEVFFYVLLPPIIFEAAFSLEHHLFWQHIDGVLALCVIGTFVSAVVVGYGLYWLSPLVGIMGDESSRLYLCLIFGALISAIDPVATLSIFDKFPSCPADLYSLMFGESVLNDAVCLVLFHGFLKMYQRGGTKGTSLGGVVLSFLEVSWGSLLIGLVLGGLVSALFKNHQQLKRHPEFEVALTFFSAYLSYGLAELYDFSGITALFFCGVMLAHYNKRNLSERSRISSDVTFKTLAVVAETAAFAYLGFVAADSIGFYDWNAAFIAVSLVLCVVGRAAHVFPISAALNACRPREQRISINKQVFLFVGGLRGAICFALALNVPCDINANTGEIEATCKHDKDVIVTSTIVLIVATTIGLGSILEPIAVSLKVISPHDSPLPLPPHGNGTDDGPDVPVDGPQPPPLLNGGQADTYLPLQEIRWGAHHADSDAQLPLIGSRQQHGDDDVEVHPMLPPTVPLELLPSPVISYVASSSQHGASPDRMIHRPPSSPLAAHMTTTSTAESALPPSIFVPRPECNRLRDTEASGEHAHAAVPVTRSVPLPNHSPFGNGHDLPTPYLLPGVQHDHTHTPERLPVDHEATDGRRCAWRWSDGDRGMPSSPLSEGRGDRTGRAGGGGAGGRLQHHINDTRRRHDDGEAGLPPWKDIVKDTAGYLGEFVSDFLRSPSKTPARGAAREDPDDGLGRLGRGAGGCEASRGADDAI
ncbi:unnamed protein product [Vitrella brassicaformis CCMP3155]|uniref:Sodium/hydrogen exchanger n=1 Tax=Vitrella brassicaformis (strain CCMP3155) TaxID=1169540 RepID=A0A0G4GQZ5_VITBC|nr:unnamed protein product [Vitrella brassicaformis CCMP3155]|eukprot:CEM32871.1 unnamed protein product [Vitrella brassicaformis CCMP3155]